MFKLLNLTNFVHRFISVVYNISVHLCAHLFHTKYISQMSLPTYSKFRNIFVSDKIKWNSSILIVLALTKKEKKKQNWTFEFSIKNVCAFLMSLRGSKMFFESKSKIIKNKNNFWKITFFFNFVKIKKKNVMGADFYPPYV